jgi:Bifunctional DNA primase/polymerase, N-terminal
LLILLQNTEQRAASWCDLTRSAFPKFEWQKRHDTNEDEIVLWDRVYPYDHNTGCLTKYTPTLDVDITDRAACRAVFDRIVERFEDCGVILCRVGNPPKFAVPFRTSAPFRKFEAKLVAPSGKPMKFEFLGDGQQFVVAGIHPDTRQSYRWWPKDRDLTTVPRDALPHINEAGARALVADLAAVLVNDLGFTRPEEKARYTFVTNANARQATVKAFDANDLSTAELVARLVAAGAGAPEATDDPTKLN